MKHRILAASMALSFAFSDAQALHAAPLSGLHLPINAKMGKIKTVSVKLQNASQAAVTVQAGTQQIVLQPGTTSMVKVPVGTQLTNVNATATYTVGAVFATVNSDMNGNTLTIN